jgi:tRNA threonylcarbamoyladenosine modification (KEOPS) complex  Pcc1 subunit
MIIKIKSKDLKRMRAVVAGTFKHIKLITSTIQQFG